MKGNRLAIKMGAIFLCFALLVLFSVWATSLGLSAQKESAVVINLAGRQRMLVQQMTRLVIEIENQGLAEDLALLQESQRTFDQTLTALRDGGLAPYLDGRGVRLPKTDSGLITAQIDQVEQTWQSYQEFLSVIQTAPSGSQPFSQAVQSAENLSAPLVAQADQLVQLFEIQSTEKLNALRWLQAAFLVSALGLLLTGVWVTYRSVIHPLQNLGNAAHRIGIGDLVTPVQVQSDMEIQLLSDTLEDMRCKLLASQNELLDWNNALEERVTQRTQALEILNAVSQEIASRLDIQQVLNSVVEKSRQLLGADAAFLCLLDDQKNSLNLQSTNGAMDAVEACDTTADAAWARQVISSDQAMRCEVDGCHGFCQIVSPPYRTSHLAAPLSIGNRVIGALCVASQQPAFFTADSVSYLTRVANIASIALENARLYAQLERSSTLEERHRIAAEMHDGLAQTLSYLTIATDLASDQLVSGDHLQAQQTLKRVKHGVDQASNDIRRAIASLHDEFPTQYTLQQQLNSLVDELKNNLPLIEWQNQTNLPLVLAHTESEQVLRVVREAVINAAKHSQATKAWVSLKRFNGTAVVSVEDNGIGFDPENVPLKDRPHFGLKIMQARAARLGGKLEVRSQPGQGTKVVLAWPLEKNQSHE